MAVENEMSEAKRLKRLLSEANEQTNALSDERDELEAKLEFERSCQRDQNEHETKELAKRLFVQSLHITKQDSVGNKAIYAIAHAERFMKTWDDKKIITSVMWDECANDELQGRFRKAVEYWQHETIAQRDIAEKQCKEVIRLQRVIRLAADRVPAIEHEGDAIEEAALIKSEYDGWFCSSCGKRSEDSDGPLCDECEGEPDV